MKKPGPKTPRGKKKTYSFTLLPKMYKNLRTLAKNENISASKWIERAVLRRLAGLHYMKNHSITLEK